VSEHGLYALAPRFSFFTATETNQFSSLLVPNSEFYTSFKILQTSRIFALHNVTDFHTHETSPLSAGVLALTS
jgi:hypothetical protein